MGLLETYLITLKDAIDRGIVSKDSHNIFEYKEKIIDILIAIQQSAGFADINRTQIAEEVKKKFADILGIE